MTDGAAAVVSVFLDAEGDEPFVDPEVSTWKAVSSMKIQILHKSKNCHFIDKIPFKFEKGH